MAKRANPTKAHNTFEGWYKDSDYTQKFDFSTETIKNDITLYAKWTMNTCTVIFLLNQGSPEIASQEVNSGEKAIKPDNPTRSDYAFEGWYTDQAPTTPFDFDTPITEDITLYAQWTTAITHTVSFSTGMGASFIEDENPVTGTTITPPDAPTRSGYAFEGWYTDQALTTSFNFDMPITADITLYAKWAAVSSH